MGVEPYKGHGRFNLSIENRFGVKGIMDDLNRAIDIQEDLMLLMPEDDPIQAFGLSSLARSLYRRIEATKTDEDLDWEISADKQGVALTLNDDDPGIAYYLYNLGHALQTRFEKTKALDDIN